MHTHPAGCHQRSRVWALQRGAAARPTAAGALGVLYAVKLSLRPRRLCLLPQLSRQLLLTPNAEV